LGLRNFGRNRIMWCKIIYFYPSQSKGGGRNSQSVCIRLSTLSPPTPLVPEGWNLAGIILKRDGSKSVVLDFWNFAQKVRKLTSKLCSDSKLAEGTLDFEPSLWGLFLSNFSLLGLKVEEEIEVIDLLVASC